MEPSQYTLPAELGKLNYTEAETAVTDLGLRRGPACTVALRAQQASRVLRGEDDNFSDMHP